MSPTASATAKAAQRADRLMVAKSSKTSVYKILPAAYRHGMKENRTSIIKIAGLICFVL